MATKPSLEEVLKYARRATASYLKSFNSKLPAEHREDIYQEAALRLIKAYDQMDPDRGIRAFCQIHCRGAVLDYIRGGDGFEESAGGKAKPQSEQESEEPTEAYPDRLRFRAQVTSDDGTALDAEEIAGLFGVFAGEDSTGIRPNWPLLSRLAGKDPDLHLVCKVLLGFSQEEIAARFGKSITRERLSQRLREFFDRLDSPLGIGNRQIEQTIYALGLAEHFGTADRDNGFGWNLKPFDLIDEDSFERALEHYEPAFDGIRETKLRKSDIFGKYRVAPKATDEPVWDEENQIAFDLGPM